MLKGRKPLKGDTLIEVMFAVAIFGLAAVGTIALMNRGLASTQNSLETTMARQEIDAQAEALRFLHNAYLSEPKKSEATSLDQVCANPTSYRDLWKCLTSSQYTYTSSSVSTTGSVTSEDPDFYTRTTTPGHYCDDLFHTNSTTSFSVPSKSFVLNPRALDISDLDTADDITNVLKKTIVTNDVQATRINLAGTYPRLLYGDSISTDDGNFSDATIGNGNKIVYGNNKKILQSAEGIWVTSVASPSGVQCTNEDGIRPDYYDFHIQTCWDSAASNSASTIKSTVRLFNPDQVALTSKKNSISFEDDNWVSFDNILAKCADPDLRDANFSIWSCQTDVSPPKHIAYYDDNDYPDHTIFRDNGDGTGTLTFIGYHASAMDEGKYIDLAGETELDIQLNAKSRGYTGHTNGTFHLSIGTSGGNTALVTADINEHGGNVAIGNNSKTMGQNFGFWIHYSYGTYTVYARADTDYNDLDSGDIIGTLSAPDDGGNIRITLSYTHATHGCELRDEAVIENIKITRPPTATTSGNDCYHVDAATNQNSINLGDDQRDGSQDQTGSEPEEPEPAATEISVTSNNQRLSYVFESDSFMGQTIGSTIPTFNWGYWSDQWGSSNWEEISASSENIHLRYGQLYPFPDYGSTMPETFIIYSTSSLPKAFAARVCSGGPDCYNSVTGSVAPQFGPLYRRDATGEGRTWVIAKIKHPANTSTFYFTPINKLTNADPSTFSSL